MGDRINEPIKAGDVEEYNFGVDSERMMDIVKERMYSSKDSFLRELISNASDACSKMRRFSFDLSEAGYQVDAASLCIDISVDKDARTIEVKDNGIGMTKSDLKNFIGTIAKSGTMDFKKSFGKDEGVGEGPQTAIGEFGVGFYSTFAVSDKVTLVTKNPKDEAWVWASTGVDSYTIAKYDGAPFVHGTSVVLYIKEGLDEFLKQDKIMEVVKKNSGFIGYPIYLWMEEEVEDVDDEKKEDEDVDEETGEPKVEEVNEDKEKEKKKMKKVMVRKRINAEKPLWTRNIDDVPDEELISFYKSISGDWDKYLTVGSWTIEGGCSLKIMLFVPSRGRFDIFSKDKKNNWIKLYNCGVFVTDNFNDIIPDWVFGIVSGVIASNDISMNVSREFAQGKGAMKLIKKIVPQKTLDMVLNLAKNDPEKFKTFLKEFGNCMKMGLSEATDNSFQEKFAMCLRYYTTKSEEEMVSLDEYIGRMAEGQKQIYLVTGLGKGQVRKNPALDAFRDYEVIYMPDAMDEISLRAFKTYKGYTLQNITKEGVEFPGATPGSDDLVKLYEPFCKKVKDILGNKVEKVIINPRLTESPGFVSVTKYSMTGTMESIMKSQPVAEANPVIAMTATSKKIFEMNPSHKITSNLKSLFENNEIDRMAALLELFFEASLISGGFTLPDPSKFCSNIFSLLSEKAFEPQSSVEEAVEEVL